MDSQWGGEAKYQALLAVAQAANSQRDLSSVLEAVAGALEGLVPVDLIGVFTHERGGARDRAIYVRSDPRRSDESQEAYVRRISERTGATESTYEHTPTVRDAIERDRRTVVFDDVRSDPRLEGTGMKRAGAECAVVLPLTMGDVFVAAIMFGRTRPSPFPPDEVTILEDVARPVTTAVANALAFEEIQKLRSQLEDENLALAGGDRRDGGGGRDHRGLRRAARGAGAGRTRGGDRLDRADHGRDRDGEGARRARDPRGVALGPSARS